MFKNMLHFYSLIIKLLETEIKNNPTYNYVKQNKTPRNKLTQGDKKTGVLKL